MKKRLLAMLLCVCMAVTLLPVTALADDDAELAFPFTYDGITYASIGDLATVKQEVLLPSIFSTQNLLSGTINTLGEQWMAVAELAYSSLFTLESDGGAFSGSPTLGSTNINRDRAYMAFGAGDKSEAAYSYSGSAQYNTSGAEFVYAASMANAYQGIVDGISAAQTAIGDAGGSVPGALSGVSDNTGGGPAVYSWQAGIVPKGTADLQDGTFIALAVIHDNFKLTPVLPDGVGLAQETSAPVSSTAAAGTGVANSTGVPVTMSQSLSQQVSETVSSSLSGTEQYSFSESLSIARQVSASVDAIIAQVSASVTTTVGFTAEQMISSTWSEQESLTRSETSTRGVELTLPAYTQVYLNQVTGSTDTTITYDCPIYLTYDTTVLCLMWRPQGGSNPPTAAQVLCTFSGDAQQDFARRFPLPASGDDDGINWEKGLKNMLWFAKEKKADRAAVHLQYFILGSTQYNSSTYSAAFNSNSRANMPIATRMAGNRPTSVSGGTLTYRAESVSFNIREIGPLLPLASVTPAAGRSMSFAVGDAMYAEDIALLGKNASGGEFYGFLSDKGTWSLVDAENVLTLTYDNTSGLHELKAVGAGEAYLRYTPDKTAYADGMVLDSATLTIPVKVTAAPTDLTGYTVSAQDALEVVVDEAVALSTLDADVTDENDFIVSHTVSWIPQDTTGTYPLKIENGRLTATAPGTYAIKAAYLAGGTPIYADNWTTVTAKLSDDTSLSSLTVGGQSIPVTGFTSYTGTVDAAVTSIDISAQATHKDAKVDGVGTLTLDEGVNTFTVTVTAADGTTKTNYPITIVRGTPEVTTLTPASRTLSSSGGSVTFTVSGSYLPPVQLRTGDGGTPVAAAGTETQQTATLSFPANASTTDSAVYTIEVSLDGGNTWLATPTATVTVSATSGGGGGGGGVSIPDGDTPGADWVNPFADVSEDDGFYDAIRWAVQNDVTDGTTETTFSPGGAVTRAQAVTFLWRAYGCPAPASAAHPFEDVDAEAYYYTAMLWAVEQGVTDGTAEAAFSPHATLTRAEMLTFLWRAAGRPAADVAVVFADVPEGVYYAEAVRWAVGAGLAAGEDGLFGAAAPCPRWQVVTFLYLLLGDES